MNQAAITFIVTQACQLECKYCYLVGKNTKENMTADMSKRIVDYIFSDEKLQLNESVVFDFIGGEPLLEIHLIKETMDYIVGIMEKRQHKWLADYEIRITTNGLLYANDDVQSFIKRYHDHLDISISIDGTKAKNDKNRVFRNGTGSYDKIINNVRLWLKQFPNEGTKMTISHDDLPYVCESLIHHLQLGMKRIDVNPVVEDVWKDGDDIIFEEQMIKFADYIIDNDVWEDLDISAFHEFVGRSQPKGINLFPCGAMRLSIDANGDFYSCIRFAKYSLNNRQPLKIGNVYMGIDYNKAKVLDLMYHNIVSSRKCIECEVASGCKWCPAESYDVHGTSFVRTTYACKIHKAKVRAKNYYWNKLKNKYM